MRIKTGLQACRVRAMVALSTSLAGAIAFSVVASAPASLQSELDGKRNQLAQAEQEEGVLSSTIKSYSNRIEQLSSEVAALRNREAAVHDQLKGTEARLAREESHLEVVSERLRRALKVLSDRLVAIYKSDDPDLLTVVLEADGFDDLLDRYEYLTAIQTQDSAIVHRVRDLRDETRETVQQIEAARDRLADKESELESTRSQLEARESELVTARKRKAAALADVQADKRRLEGAISGIEGKIQAQLQAAQSAVSTQQVPAGPVQQGSGGMIWPVSGPVTSGYGMRWGRMHEGIDISASSGTPIRAAKSGSIALASPYGGYGNYTCIAHGGGLSTCYAHQSSFAKTSGSVSQGEVIGYVGCTGSCYGDHLHFEVRVNGSAVDPMGYL